jgi:hypothetical protein
MFCLKKLTCMLALGFLAPGIYGQSAEERASQDYIQNPTTVTDNHTVTIKGGSYYNFNGKKYVPQNDVIAWVGSTAVMNSVDGSFQVIFKTMPRESKKYKVKPYGTFYNLGQEGEASIALLTDSYDHQFWSVEPNTGKIQVKIKGNKVVVMVNDVKICSSEGNNCKTITGQIILNKE